MTTKDPRECKHYKRGWCIIDIKAVYRPRRATPDFIHAKCSGLWNHFTPKTDKK